MATYKVNDSCLAIAFAPASGYTPAVGNLVKLSAAWEINVCGDEDNFLGRVINVDQFATTKTVTVLTRFTQLVQLTAGAAISAAAVLVPAGSNKVKTESSDHAMDIVGYALEAASGDGILFHALIY